MNIRELKDTDMPQWIALVKQLSGSSSTGALTDRSAWLNLTRLQPKVILIAEDNEKIIGTASILFEEKVNRGTHSANGQFYSVAHIEEVVVDKDHRDQNIGKQLMDKCLEYAKKHHAYKVILDCSEENVAFYEKCGYHRHEVCMRLDI